MKSRATENNLIFFGIDDKEEYGEKEGILREFIGSEITLPESKNVEHFTFTKVHRIGRKKTDQEQRDPRVKVRPRPIVAQFDKFEDREAVRNAASTITNTKFGVREDFPIEIETKEKKPISNYENSFEPN